jgi:tetratricopeptide (TPR) repeat protein
MDACDCRPHTGASIRLYFHPAFWRRAVNPPLPITKAPTVRDSVLSDDLFRWCAAGVEDPARAERYFRKYLSQQEPEGETPSLAAARWRLGLALEKENRKEEALREIQAAVKMDPNLKEAQSDLKRVKNH